MSAVAGLRRLLGGLGLPRRWPNLPLEDARLVVVDVETTGLSVRQDQLLAIGGVVIEGLRLDLGQQFECTLRIQTGRALDNVLIHGIPPEELARGRAPDRALRAFLEFVGDSPLFAFHAPFDQRVLQRACRRFLATQLRNPFLDVAELAPALLPERRPQPGTLDGWLAEFGLSVSERHNAAADAMATAELLLILLHAARRQGIDDLDGLSTRLKISRRLQKVRESGN
jgi:DNA polymerase-3 subunit epsilon